MTQHTDHTPLTDQQLDEIAERLSEARLVAEKADWMLQDYQVVRQQQADATALLAEIHRLRDGEEQPASRDEVAATLKQDGFSPDEVADMLHPDLASADNPTPLRWGLNDVLWGDDDTVTVLMSGPDREPYWLELEPERAAVLRQDLAGPDGEQAFRALTPSEYNTAWHAVEGAAGEEGADPGTVLHAVLDRLGIGWQDAAHPAAASAAGGAR